MMAEAEAICVINAEKIALQRTGSHKPLFFIKRVLAYPERIMLWELALRNKT